MMNFISMYHPPIKTAAPSPACAFAIPPVEVKASADARKKEHHIVSFLSLSMIMSLPVPRSRSHNRKLPLGKYAVPAAL